MRVRFTDTAEADLEEIADYIAADDPDIAVEFVMDIRETCLGLSEYPDRYPLVPSTVYSALRRRPFGNYLIYYRADAAEVVVSRVVHAARDFKRLSFPDD
jgi:plasmid stabilization system protein ParE